MEGHPGSLLYVCIFLSYCQSWWNPKRRKAHGGTAGAVCVPVRLLFFCKVFSVNVLCMHHSIGRVWTYSVMFVNAQIPVILKFKVRLFAPGRFACAFSQWSMQVCCFLPWVLVCTGQCGSKSIPLVHITCPNMMWCNTRVSFLDSSDLSYKEVCLQYMFWVCLVALTLPEGMKNNTNIFIDNDQGIHKLNMIFHLNKDMHLSPLQYFPQSWPLQLWAKKQDCFVCYSLFSFSLIWNGAVFIRGAVILPWSHA